MYIWNKKKPFYISDHISLSYIAKCSSNAWLHMKQCKKCILWGQCVLVLLTLSLHTYLTERILHTSEWRRGVGGGSNPLGQSLHFYTSLGIASLHFTEKLCIRFVCLIGYDLWKGVALQKMRCGPLLKTLWGKYASHLKPCLTAAVYLVVLSSLSQ